jgi:hypothetical protein
MAEKNSLRIVRDDVIEYLNRENALLKNVGVIWVNEVKQILGDSGM